MRTLLVLPIVLMGMGCRHLDRTCDAAACPPPEPTCAPEIRVKAPPQKIIVERHREERQTSSAPSLGQEVMLVPRTVYVPYAPQIPVAPLRMVTSRPCLGATDCSTGDLSQSQKELDRLHQRIQQLEAELKRVCPTSAAPSSGAPNALVPGATTDLMPLVPSALSETTHLKP